MAENFYVYILASTHNGTLYIGVTNNLIRRVYEHKEGIVPGFTRTYKVHNLVYYEPYSDPQSAIQREKTMKKWPRQWKINKIQESNPTWRDLYEEIAQG